MKACSKCGHDKNESEFRKRTDRKSGYRGVCKLCESPMLRESGRKSDAKRTTEYSKNKWKNRRDNLLDSYIKTLFKGTKPTTEQIEEKRLVLKIKRKLNEIGKINPQ